MKLKKKLAIIFGLVILVFFILVITHIPQPEPTTFSRIVTDTILRTQNG
jgi:hypothetical protein